MHNGSSNFIANLKNVSQAIFISLFLSVLWLFARQTYIMRVKHLGHNPVLLFYNLSVMVLIKVLSKLHSYPNWGFCKEE